MIVMEVISRGFGLSFLWELLYADDSVVLVDSEEEVIRKFDVWNLDRGFSKEGVEGEFVFETS